MSHILYYEAEQEALRLGEKETADKIREMVRQFPGPLRDSEFNTPRWYRPDHRAKLIQNILDKARKP